MSKHGGWGQHPPFFAQKNDRHRPCMDRRHTASSLFIVCTRRQASSKQLYMTVSACAGTVCVCKAHVRLYTKKQRLLSVAIKWHFFSLHVP